MKTPHKHAELIKAWAMGERIQCRGMTDGAWHDIEHPTWLEAVEYRIKPERWYRVALFRPTPGRGPLELVFTDGGEELAPNAEGFIRWLTPRTEYEVDAG